MLEINDDMRYERFWLLCCITTYLVRRMSPFFWRSLEERRDNLFFCQMQTSTKKKQKHFRISVSNWSEAILISIFIGFVAESKGLGHVTVNKPVTFIIYIVSCTDFYGWGESTINLLLKIRPGQASSPHIHRP